MFNILDFIDSPDIREYNKNTKFTPAEQAILIKHSYGTTIEEKINALQELVDTYDAEGFQVESILCNRGYEERIKIRQAVLCEIQKWKGALEVRKSSENAVYLACFSYREESDFYDDIVYFSTYELAYQYLQEQKQEALEDSEWRNWESYAYIKRMVLDCGNQDYDEYKFDNQLRLVQIRPRCGAYGPKDFIMDLDAWYMYVPLPFKKGDLIKVISPFRKTQYGVMACDCITKEEDFKRREGWGDSSDMIKHIDIYNGDSPTHKFDYTDNTFVLHMQLCTEEELPEDQKMLMNIRDVRIGKYDWSVLLYENT